MRVAALPLSFRPQLNAVTAALRPYATHTGVNKQAGEMTGDVWAKIGGRRVTIGTGATDSWVVGAGRYVAWAGLDGSGGYENEGQSLRVYDTQTGEVRKVMSEYTMVDRVNSLPLTNRKTALLVAMSDGGLGADHFAVVDPERGEVFRARGAKALRLEGDKVVVGYFRNDEYDKPENQRRPYRTETLDLKELLTRPVIVNPSDRI